ncbi:YcjX family protein [Arsukibacterium sp.]|uniref:YcjX family protein n=1 Tax=Arsukibacterium sp. TaxID=1977258 RepID=UPI002FD93ECE
MSWLDMLQHQTRQLGQRALDQQLRLGITGLSGAGKTAFITSLVHQLCSGDLPEHLPFFEVVQQGRYLGGRLSNEQPLSIPRFAYERNLASLLGNPASWPVSTIGWSQLDLQLRYKPRNRLRASISHHSELHLQIIDYPGEWLLDLPLLRQSYQQWCEFSWQLFRQPHRQALSAPFAKRLAALNLQDASVPQLQQLAAEYAELLTQFRQLAGTYLNQPGRLLVPGELAGAPMLQLLPLLPEQLAQASPLLNKLSEHYSSYCQFVVKPFYKQHFASIDRQVVLVDCLSALNAGHAAMAELQQALALIMQSFQYGPSSLLRRLFQPRISRVLFAATKADHVTPEQHKALTLLLQQLLQQPIKHSHYAAAHSEVMALAAIRASSSGTVRQDGQLQLCISGLQRSDSLLVTLFPGEVPASLPPAELYQQHHFAFPDFLPPAVALQQPLPHVRMDHALQYLLGDKLR